MDENVLVEWFIVRPAITVGTLVYAYMTYSFYTWGNFKTFLIFLGILPIFAVTNYIVWFKK